MNNENIQIYFCSIIYSLFVSNWLLDYKNIQVWILLMLGGQMYIICKSQKNVDITVWFLWSNKLDSTHFYQQQINRIEA